MGVPGVRSDGTAHPPHHSAPCRGYGPAPLGGWTLRLSDLGSWVVPGIATLVPTRYTHPVYPPRHPPDTARRAHPGPTTVHGTLRTCTYDRFRPVLGEPRGVEYSAVSGSQTGLYCIYRFTRPFDWVLDRYLHVLLSLVPVLGPVLLSLVPVLGPVLLSLGPVLHLPHASCL